MVRETRHLWVGNLPDNIREDRIREHFKRYGRVQNVKLLGRTETATTGPNGVAVSGVCATVAFMDIKSASKAHNAEHVVDERTLTTEYYEPAAIPSAAGAPSAGSSPAGSGYSGSSSSVNSASVPAPAPAPATVSRYHLSGGEEVSGTCALAATAAAPANWRGTNDSASEYCRRGNTPSAYGRYQRNNSTAPYSTPPSNVDRSTPHHRWYASAERDRGGGGGGGGSSTPSTPGGGTEGGGARRRRRSGSGSSRTDSSSPEPSDASRASTPAAQPPPQGHAPHTPNSTANRTPPTTTHHQWSTTTNGRPLAICVRNLPTRSTDSSLKDGLYHEYKKHGKVMWVKVVGQNADRYAVVRFKKPSDVEKALEVSQDKLFFGCKISVAPHQSCDEDAETAKPYETDIDEYHPKATRTLFIGNLEKDVTQQQLRDKFKHFGRIIEIDIKKGSGGGSGYAFCQYASISSVVEAIRAMDGEHVGGSRVKLGFGKPVATTCVFVDGLTEHTEKQVLSCISRCGAATSVCVDRAAGAALIHFEQAGAAGAAVRELRRVAAHASAADPDRPRLAVDYASRECQDAFYEQLEQHGGSAPLPPLPASERVAGEVPPRYVPAPRHDPLRYDSCSSRSRASSYTRASSRTPRYPSLEHYEPADYPADRRYRVYDELGSSPQTEETPYEDRLQSVVVSPHRSRRHHRDSSPAEDRKHSKDRHLKNIVGAVSLRRSRSGSRCGERHGSRRRHRRRRDGSGSRAGTPLRDEPDAPPCEPRRPPAPRDRPVLPMSLPLPRFAAQLLRAAPHAPRAHPAPAPSTAPASPPRPPSASSSSAGSAPHSPSLEERIRSLDEKYEKWSGCRAQQDAHAPDRARLKHRLLEVDINEVKPSEVVRSLLAKRSVFDEDSERLEGAVRAPSPAGSPRTPRALGPSPATPTTPGPLRAARYPFPAHPPQPAHPAPLEDDERPADPRLNRPERPPYQPEKLGKINESDYRLEPRARLRTPSTDKPPPAEAHTPRPEPKQDKPDGERDPRTPRAPHTPHTPRRRRDSLCASRDDADRNTKEAIEKIDPDFEPRERRSSLNLDRQQKIDSDHPGAERRSSLTSDRHIKIELEHPSIERRSSLTLDVDSQPVERRSSQSSDKHQKVDLVNQPIERRPSQTLDKHQKVDVDHQPMERRPSQTLDKHQKVDVDHQPIERRPSQTLDKHQKVDVDHQPIERRPSQTLDKHQKVDVDHQPIERRPPQTLDKHQKVDVDHQPIERRPSQSLDKHQKFDVDHQPIERRPSQSLDKHQKFDVDHQPIERRPSQSLDKHQKFDVDHQPIERRPSQSLDKHQKFDVDHQPIERRPSQSLDKQQKFDVDHQPIERRPSQSLDKHQKFDVDHQPIERRPSQSLDKHQKADVDPEPIERRPSQSLDKHDIERRHSLSQDVYQYEKIDQDNHSSERRPSLPVDKHQNIDSDIHNLQRKHSQINDKHQKKDIERRSIERRPSLTLDKHQVEKSLGSDDKTPSISPSSKSDAYDDKRDAQTESSVTSGSDENDSRLEDFRPNEKMQECAKIELSTDKEPSSSDESSVKSNSIKSETSIGQLVLPQVNDLCKHIDNKLDHVNFHIKSESDKCKDITIQNNISKELQEFELQHSHLNPINSIITCKEAVELSNELLKGHDKNGKERFTQNAILEAFHTKLEKENIEFDKSSDSEKYGNNSLLLTLEKKHDNDKVDERSKHDREKLKHHKEKHEHIEKYRSIKMERSEKSDKEKRSKDDLFVEKIKTEKDADKPHKEKSERESDKKHGEEKLTRHEHHRKDKSEKDKRKENDDKDTAKAKKEDKHKHDKSKKEGECKSKKDESKSRKSSRDESARDLCRKDSTDSSASRASHESTKIKELEQAEPKDDKTKIKLCDMFIKLEPEKDVLKPIEQIKIEPGTIKIKSEIKEEKDLPEPPAKNKTNNILEPPFKCKPETIDKQRHYSVDSPSLECKRKERLNSSSSLPSHIGHKRRMSSQDSFDSVNDDYKKPRNETKAPERRDSKDSRSTERHKTTKFNKGHFAKLIESKTKDDKKNQVKPPDDNVMKDDTKEAKKSSKKNIQSDSEERGNTSNEHQPEGLHNDHLDFLATLELRSSEEDERQKALRKEMKEKKRIQQLQQIQELQMQQDALHQAELMGKLKEEKKYKTDEKKKEAAREKRMSTDRKSRDEKSDSNTTKRKNRKSLQSTDTSDSDEPKKHSIFDIIDDEPTYISMYDKVKARSCKNMQKQEEEKRQEKIKAKFSQLKQSRAKREEKKRSSWDEDSDSENDRRKPQRLSMDSSSEDEQIVIQNKKYDKSRRSSHDYDRMKVNDYYNIPSNEEDSRNKLSRKNSRTRIISDTSDDEMSKRSISKSPNMHDIRKGLLSSFDLLRKEKDDETPPKESTDKTKQNSLLHLFGKSDSDDNKFKIGLEITDRKPGFLKMPSNEFSSESESTLTHRIMGEIRKKHKKKQKNKYKTALSDDESRVESSDALPQEGDHKSKSLEKFRRHSNKKEKRKDKSKESFDADDRDDKVKTKKDKKPTNNSMDLILDSSSNNKKDGKMEDIFGPLSDESEKDETVQNKVEFSSHGYDTSISTPNDQSRAEETKLKEKDENRRKKEKKRKDRRPFVKEDENSLDVDAVSKAIEARLFADVMNDDESKVKMEPHMDAFSKPQHNVFSFTDSDIPAEATKLYEKHGDKNRRENKEKRKKKKRNREERRKEHHHSSSHTDKYDKSDFVSCGKSVESLSPKSMLLDIPLPNDTQTINLSEKSDDSKSLSESPSLPRLTDSPPMALQICDDPISMRKNSDVSEHTLSDNDMDVEFIPEQPIEVKDIPMPQKPYENNIVQDISEVPLPKDPLPTKCEQPKQDNFLPSFDSIDVSEDAVRSIPNVEEAEKPGDKNDHNINKVEKKVEEKPRAVISQEETADAVAALLGESFGGKENTFSNCYEEAESDSAHQVEIESATIENENIPEEDAEEMRRAVQNLNASEMEMKPDTPMSDNDLLLIDTDTEEAEETPQDTTDRTPVTVIPTSQPQSLTITSEPSKPEEPPKAVTVSKPEIPLIVTSEPNQANVKPVEQQIKSPPPKRDNVSQPTSTATPVITSWTLTNNKLIEPHVVNIQANQLHNRDSGEKKPTHITANIVQIKAPHSQGLSTSLRPIISPSRVSAPYQVLNHIIRPQTSNMQPPTIKIPESHIIYQKPPSIVISPRMANDPRLPSPKSSPQGEGMTSPRLANMTILSTSPQNINSVGLVSPNAIQQRSPGQVTVVRMQQPPLSPIQSMHLPPGTRTMVSPNRPNSVLVQSGPIHFNRLPVTPVLAPISKQMSTNNIVQQNKSIVVSTSPMLHQQKLIPGDQRNATENVTEKSKIILPATSLQHSTNPTVMAQNRLISLQNKIHVGNINTPLHFGNKVLINNISQLGEKRENHISKSEHHNHLPFGSAPIIHVANVSHAGAPIIQTGPKPVTLQDRGLNSNVIHTLNSQRLLTTAPVTSVIHMDTSKSTPTVLSMATIRSPSVLTKIDSSNSAVITTASHTNVVTTPLILKTTTTPSTIRLSARIDGLQAESPLNVKLLNSMPRIDDKTDLITDTPKITSNIYETLNKQKDNLSSSDSVQKCETDFEELLKDNTNEIKVTNDPEKKLEVNVGKTTTLIERKKSVEIFKEEEIKKEEPPLTKSPLEPPSTEKKELVGNQIFKEIKDPQEEIKKEIDVKSKEEVLTPPKNVSLDSDFNKKINEKPKQQETKSNSSVNDNFLGFSSDLPESNDNQLKGLDENDSWSAKDVNIESVIKKVDSLCNDSPDAEKNMEVNETPVKENSETEQQTNTSSSTDTASDTSKPMEVSSENESFETNPGEEFNTEKSTTNKRGGRNVRGKRAEKNQDRVQTRQISKPARGASSAKRGRGGRSKVDKKIKNLVNNSTNNMPGDVYDFHEDSGDETSASSNKTETRPRLILTIKSPLSGTCTAIPTSTLSITPKEQQKVAEKVNKEDKPEDFISPAAAAANTRKSRRLLEKDVQRSTVDDVIEDVVKGTSTRGAKEPGKKRQTRQTGTKVNQAEKAAGSDTRKSPRGVKRPRDRSLSDASVDSSDEKIPKRDDSKTDQSPKEPKDSKITKLTEPPAAPKIEPDPPQPAKTIAPVPVTVTPPSNPTPIMKPPKKMLSEIAKMTNAFEAAANAPPPVRALLPSERMSVEPEKRPLPMLQPATITPAVSDHMTAATGDARVNVSAGCGMDVAGASGEAALVRRLEGPTGSGGVPVGATEASDARVQSPALPHRPPSAHRLADRATPLLIRGADGEGASMAAVGSGAAGGGARLPRGYAGTASLPRGAHHPAPPHVPPPALPAHPAHPAHPALPAHPHAKQVAVVGPHHHHPGAGSRVTITSVPAVSPQGPMAMGEGMYPHFSHQHYQMYQQHFRATQHESRATPSPYTLSLEAEGCETPTPPLELRRPAAARAPPRPRAPPPRPRPAHSPATAPAPSPAPAPAPSPADRLIMYAAGCGRSPPPAHGTSRLPSALPPSAAPGPPHASQVPREADSLQMLLRRYPVMWQGLLALKNDAAAVQMHFVGGNPGVAGDTLPRHTDGSTPPLRIAQRMRLEPAQLDQVHRKMKLENEHCILLALPCGRDHMDVLQQSTNLTHGFITYLQRKQAAGIVNVAPPGHQQAMYTVHIFPSCDFANENLNRIAPDLMHRVADIAHLLIVIATV